jgi:N-acetylglucosamine-6-phosphate deacetylase
MAFIDPTDYNLEQLIEGFEDMIRIITISPELDGSLALIKRISARGIIASMGHSNATYSEAEAGHKAGAKGITHLFNAMRPYHHREPGITGYGLLNPGIYIEVIADPFHLHPVTLELIFRVKDPARIIIVSDSIREAKVPATPVSTQEGLADIHGRLLGGSMAITEAADHLAEILPNILLESHDKSIILDCISANPERYLA